MQDPYLMQISKGQAPIKKQIKFFTLFTFLRLLTKAWWWEPHFRRFKVDLCTKNCKLVHTECKSTEPTELILSKQEKPLMATDAPSNTKPSLSPFRQKRTTIPLPNPSLSLSQTANSIKNLKSICSSKTLFPLPPLSTKLQTTGNSTPNLHLLRKSRLNSPNHQPKPVPLQETLRFSPIWSRSSPSQTLGPQSLEQQLQTFTLRSKPTHFSSNLQ